MKYPQLVSMPSAVSDWLEEQLEARGIDAVVYARYILSLLHSDPVDVIYSDEDLHFSQLKKEVRRSGGGRKRLRRSSEWWKYAQADAEKLKRSAAVECLMSASDQTGGIESLIDELCEKLKEIKNEAPVDPVPLLSKNSDLQQVSPQELAKRYYAAFPPLGKNSTTSPATLLSLIPKWIPSPKKKTSNGSVTSNNRNKHANRICHCDEKLHSRADIDNNMKARMSTKQRFGSYFGGRNNRNKDNRHVAAKSIVESMDHWDLRMFSNKIREDIFGPDEPLLQTESESYNSWNTDDELNLYEDLPVDISELLEDSPGNHDETVDMMNLANMRDTGNRGFIPYGTNITSSIWSIEAAMEQETPPQPALDLKLGSISVGHQTADWSTSSLYENGGGWNYQPTWSEMIDTCPDDDNLVESLTALNHADESPFVRANRKFKRQLYNPFAQTESTSDVDGVLQPNNPVTPIRRVDSDDLLTSINSHFRPINEKIENCVHGEYADGATFHVSSSLQKVNYKRTESGLYVESDFGICRRYGEYKPDEPEQPHRPFGGRVDLVLRFIVCQNDKGCQTEDEGGVEVPSEHCVRTDVRTIATNKDYSSFSANPIEILCGPRGSRSDSAGLTEILWKQNETIAQDGRSNNSVMWNTDCLRSFHYDPEWNDQNLRSIWSGGEVCHSCLGERPSSIVQQNKLREDISQDGDQLLSDLSSAQKSYMESLPLMEFTCDISDLLTSTSAQATGKERKRRHSLIASHSEDGASIWSFASRLEEDCLIQMSTLPTLRSVTL